MLYYGNESDEVERTTELIPVKAPSPVPLDRVIRTLYHPIELRGGENRGLTTTIKSWYSIHIDTNTHMTKALTATKLSIT